MILLKDRILKKSTTFTTLAYTGSHLLAIAVGWGIWSTFQGSPEQVRAAVEEAKAFRSKERGAPGSGRGSRNARQILDDLQRNKTDIVEVKVPRAQSYRTRLEEAEVLRKAAAQVAHAADLEGGAKGALDSYLAKLQGGGNLRDAERTEAEVRLLHWMNGDPKAVLGYLSGLSPEKLGVSDPLLRKVIDVMIPDVGVEEAAKWMGTNGKMDGKLGRIMADHAGAAADLDQLARMKGNLEPQRWNEIRLSLIDTWPFAKADDLMRLSISENAPLTVLLYAKNQGPDGVKWLQDQLASGQMDPAFQASVLKHHDYHRLMFSSPQLDFNKRVEIVQSFESGKPLEQVKNELGVFDVVNAMNAGRDWRYAFRHGTATAEQIYQEMAKSLPELAGKSPESLKLQLFKELSEFGGAKAIKLLDGVPEEKKWELVMKAPQWQFLDANPQDFYDFIRTIPPDTGGKNWQTRLSAWESKSRKNSERLGPRYVEWVRNLPEGIDREMASYVLLKQTRGSDPELAETLRSRIKDPELNRRLEGQP